MRPDENLREILPKWQTGDNSEVPLFPLINELMEQGLNLQRKVDLLSEQNARSEKTIAKLLLSNSSVSSSHLPRQGRSRSRSLARIPNPSRENPRISSRNPLRRPSVSIADSNLPNRPLRPNRQSAHPSLRTPSNPRRPKRESPNRVLIVGTKDSNGTSSLPTLPTSKLQICKAKMFISGQDASSAPPTLHRNLSEYGLSPSITRKIETRHSHYSSFQVGIPDTDVDLILNEERNSGTIVHQYRGILHDSDALETSPRGMKF